jgi:hypothetical protein
LNGRYEDSIQNFGIKSERRKPLGEPRRRREDNNKMYMEHIDWIHLAKDIVKCRRVHVTKITGYRSDEWISITHMKYSAAF